MSSSRWNAQQQQAQWPPQQQQAPGMPVPQPYPTDPSFHYAASPAHPSEAYYPQGLHPNVLAHARNGSEYGSGYYGQGNRYGSESGYGDNSLPVGGMGPSPTPSGSWSAGGVQTAGPRPSAARQMSRPMQVPAQSAYSWQQQVPYGGAINEFPGFFHKDLKAQNYYPF